LKNKKITCITWLWLYEDKKDESIIKNSQRYI
jgi:hypothetical protein